MIRWGTADGWAGVFVTLGLFIVAFIAIRNDRKQLKLLREETDRRLAGRVVVWVQATGLAQRRDRRGALIGAQTLVRLVAHNGGEEPVYELTGTLRLPGYRDGDFYKPMLPPDGTDRSLEVALQTEDPEVAEVQFYPHAVMVTITWHDGAGRHWHRDADGTLARWDPSLIVPWVERLPAYLQMALRWFSPAPRT